MFSKLKGDDGAEEDGGCHSSDSVNPSAGQISCLLKCGFLGSAQGLWILVLWGQRESQDDCVAVGQ